MKKKLTKILLTCTKITEIGTCKYEEHDIQLIENSKPIRLKPYSVPIKQTESLRQELYRLEKKIL